MFEIKVETLNDHEVKKINVFEKNKILLGDCMDLMADMPDDYIDLAVVDPPFGIGDFSQSDARNQCVDWNNEIPDENYFNELKRISKKRIIWGANYYNCFEGGNGAIVWYKNVGHPSMSHCEIASVSWQIRVGYIHINWSGGIKKNKTNHPCQKPVRLYRWILQNYAKPGQLILDTHSGSGSCAIACMLEGFDFVAIEKDRDYWKASVDRFNTEKSQLKLF
jgi:site-specific DNA-methyltransferase (adenine-specific)